MTPTSQWTRLFAANVAGGSTSALGPTATQPSGDGVLNLSAMSKPPTDLLYSGFSGRDQDDQTATRLAGSRGGGAGCSRRGRIRFGFRRRWRC